MASTTAAALAEVDLDEAITTYIELLRYGEAVQYAHGIFAVMLKTVGPERARHAIRSVAENIWTPDDELRVLGSVLEAVLKRRVLPETHVW